MEISQFFSSPEYPGAYFEVRCKNTACDKHNKKFYVLIPSKTCFDYYEEKEKILCEACSDKNLSYYNIGFIGCKWILQGSLEDGEVFIGSVNYSLGYEVCQDIKHKTWNWVQVKIEILSVEEIEKIRKVINGSFNFDVDLNNLQFSPAHTLQRFNEKNKQVLKKEVEKKRDIIYYLKKNLKDQQKIIKRLSKKIKNGNHETSET